MLRRLQRAIGSGDIVTVDFNPRKKALKKAIESRRLGAFNCHFR